MRDIDLENIRLEGHPVRWFNPQAEFAQPHVLLAGDAAGVDPLFAEGISYGMAYGRIVAQQIQHAFAHNNFRFDQYRNALKTAHLGRMLRRRAFIAQQLFIYKQPKLYNLIWQMAGIAPFAIQHAFGAFLACYHLAGKRPFCPIRAYKIIKPHKSSFCTIFHD